MKVIEKGFTQMKQMGFIIYLQSDSKYREHTLFGFPNVKLVDKIIPKESFLTDERI